MKMKRKGTGAIIIGLVFIIIGLGYIGNALGLWENFTIFFDGWWSLFIIIPCLIGMINHGVNAGNLVGLIIGVFILAANQLKDTIIWAMMIPVILISIGLLIIFKSGIFKTKTYTDTATGEIFNVPTHTAIFSGKEIRAPIGEVIKGSALTAIFGGIEMDLRQAVINEDIVFDVSTIFAGIDIKLPYNVNVVSNVDRVFSGVDIKKRENITADMPTVYLKGSCIFGGIDVK